MLKPIRPHCDLCQRPQSACICRWIRPLAPAVEVVILQHPLEVAQAKGSARLLHLSLARSRLVAGETFAADTLASLLFDAAGAAPAPALTVLLYPATPDAASLSLPAPPLLDPAVPCDPARLRLVVLDASWRKSRKMLYLNPLLQTLPRLPLSEPPPSRYRIRKAHAPDQLSTLEATCHALAQLEGDAAAYAPLLCAFDGFVAQQAGYIPAAQETNRA